MFLTSLFVVSEEQAEGVELTLAEGLATVVVNDDLDDHDRRLVVVLALHWLLGSSRSRGVEASLAADARAEISRYPD
jgi:hypothetical protein